MLNMCTTLELHQTRHTLRCYLLYHGDIAFFDNSPKGKLLVTASFYYSLYYDWIDYILMTG